MSLDSLFKVYGKLTGVKANSCNICQKSQSSLLNLKWIEIENTFPKIQNARKENLFTQLLMFPMLHIFTGFLRKWEFECFQRIMLRWSLPLTKCVREEPESETV